jgi:predicted Zn-dependent protease
MTRLHATRALSSLLVAVILSSLSSCASIDNQGVQVVEPIEAPAAPKIITESTSSAEHKRMEALFGGAYHNVAVERYLNAILEKFAKTGELGGVTYRITVLNSPIVNAFALPSGDIFVTRGLLALANDGSEVAAVMAHEIAHVTAHHAIAREEEEKRAAVISRVAHLMQTKQRGDEVDAMARQTIAGFSRQQELDADRIGIKTIAKVGFDPYGASRFLEALARSVSLRAALIGQNTTPAKPDILATHPSTPERVQAAIREARAIGAPGVGTRDRDAFLASIDGMMFGDDPSEGTIRGRTFTQPKLGFTVIAPEGFVLENSTQAVLGIKDGGAEALRLDSVAVPDTQSLDAYVHSGWIEGLLASSISKTQINGLDAITASARAGEWNFRLAVIRFDKDVVYRLIFATHGLDDAHETTYRAAFNSFRRIDPSEALAVRPLKITILRAKPGDTATTVSQRMLVADKPLETFELLNGLESAGPLTPDEHYKLVTE